MATKNELVVKIKELEMQKLGFQFKSAKQYSALTKEHLEMLVKSLLMMKDKEASASPKTPCLFCNCALNKAEESDAITRGFRMCNPCRKEHGHKEAV